MIKDIKQIVNSNFTVVVEELQKLIEQGYKVVLEGESRPYHMVLGNFIITVEKMVEKPAEEPVVDAPVVFEPIIKEEAVVAPEGVVEAVEAPAPTAAKTTAKRK